jgi:hypothetical protein
MCYPTSNPPVKWSHSLRAAGRLLVLAACICACSRSPADQPSPGTVTPAAYERNSPSDSPRSIHFARRAPQVGDQFEQQVTFDLKLHEVMRQGNKIEEQAEMVTRRRQRRVVTTSDVTNGTTVAALLRYPEATQQVITAREAKELPTLSAPVSPQPVQGKVYRCRRSGGELQITDEQGRIPPLDEYKIVAQNMETLGHASPLADYLGGRTVSIGEKLLLPHEVAERLLGLGDDLGQVSRFELVLDEVKTVGGAECGVFSASVDAASNSASQMRMQVEGRLVIQTSTCRAIEGSFAGPLGMSETRGSLTETHQMTATGRISVGIATTYRDIAL